MTPTPKPLVAGVLCIIAGASAVIGGFVLALLGLIGAGAISTFAEPDAGPLAIIPAAFFLPLALFTLICAGFSIVGGIESFQRRRWWLAMAGAVAATLSLAPLGIAAIVLVILSEKEFQSSPHPQTG
jgi:Flp pilus assembly protein protease CpaA